MATVLAEDGMWISAGLPEDLREPHVQLQAMAERDALLKQKKDRLDRLMAKIAEHEAELAELHRQAQEALKEYADASLPKRNRVSQPATIP